MTKTKIQWATHTVNPLRVEGPGRVWKHGYHCTKVSPGCAHCYSETANKLRGTGQPYDNRKVKFYLDLSVFDTLLKTKPCTVFIQSMGDLFHEDVPFDFIDRIFAKISSLPMHRFIILTKRPDRMADYYDQRRYGGHGTRSGMPAGWYRSWFGVTAENQEHFDKRVPVFMGIPVPLHFISMEPMLELIDPMLNVYLKDGPHPEWIILGAESGPKRRYCNPNDMIKVVGQCKEHDIPVFVKQIHFGRVNICENISRPSDFYVEKDINKFPPQLQIQQYPDSESEI